MRPAVRHYVPRRSVTRRQRERLKKLARELGKPRVGLLSDYAAAAQLIARWQRELDRRRPQPVRAFTLTPEEIAARYPRKSST